jgi:hypothetical protein
MLLAENNPGRRPALRLVAGFIEGVVITIWWVIVRPKNQNSLGIHWDTLAALRNKLSREFGNWVSS